MNFKNMLSSLFTYTPKEKYNFVLLENNNEDNKNNQTNKKTESSLKTKEIFPALSVNLEYVNKDVARRIVDFISGGVFALDGHIQKVSNSIFLIAPYNYEITNEMAREEISNKLSVSWLKNNTKN